MAFVLKSQIIGQEEALSDFSILQFSIGSFHWTMPDYLIPVLINRAYTLFLG